MLRLFLTAMLLGLGAPAFAAAPPPVGADHGMVVSAHRLASEVGVAILKAGGNAVDAAVAVGYVLAVVYPAAGNLGGGGFMTLHLADGRSAFLDFREKAPLAATETMFQDASGAVVPHLSTESWRATAVPGSVAGLDRALELYGSLPRAVVMAPAIRLAGEGFVLEPADVTLLNLAAADFARDPATAAIFLDHGSPYGIGDRLIQRDLAAVLQRVSDGGPAAFYRGAPARAVAAASAAGQGILQEADFAAYKVRALDPVRCSYRGFTILSAPPPSAGGVAICEVLNILEGYDLHAMGFHSAASLHVQIEAMRRAFHDRQSLGDPDFVTNPVAHLLDKAYAAELRAGISPDRATPSAALAAAPAGAPVPEGRQTTHYSVVDAAGNAVAVTTTLNSYFGTRRVAAGTGMFMNNEMDDFSSKPDAPNQFALSGSRINAIAPGKTPLSSMSPTIVLKDGETVLVAGSPGGSRIITITLETILNIVDYGMSLGEAVDAPRLHEQWRPETVDVEPYAVSPDTVARLQAEGYALQEKPPWGQAAVILRRTPGFALTDADLSPLARPAAPFRLYGANDDRGPAGAAVGY